MRVFIPGLSEVYEEERRLREVVYLDAPHYLCGIPLKQITPRIFARLLFMRTPFLMGGEVTKASIGSFLWACHLSFSLPKSVWWKRNPNAKRDAFLRSIISMDFEELEDEIDEFLDETFFDAPQGGKKDETPYVCGIASLEYRMACEPFRWSKDQTLDTPLRRIYGLLRCDSAKHGGILFNPKSDALKDEYLKDFAAMCELQKGLN